MKKIYLMLTLIAVFGINPAFAEPCPDSAIITNSGATLVVTYVDITCANMPDPVTVGTTTYNLSFCDDVNNLAVYSHSSGPFPSDSGTLTIDTGFDTVCNYTDSVLPISDFTLLNSTLKLYPNPLINGDNLNIKLATNVSAKINLYDLTGKLAMSSEMNNARSKDLNTTGLTNGVYLLRLVSETAVITRKVVIMK
jgi:hypothetical protein